MVFGGTNILQHVERNEGEGLHEWSVFINLIYQLHQLCSYIKKKNLLLETYWHLLVPQYIYDAEGFFLINLKLITSHALYLSLSLLSSIYNSIPLLLLLLLSLHFSLSLSLYIPSSYPHHLFPFIFYFSTSFSGSGDTSDSPISPDNFATKARAALNSLPSPPDKVRMCYLWSHRLQN